MGARAKSGLVPDLKTAKALWLTIPPSPPLLVVECFRNGTILDTQGRHPMATLTIKNIPELLVRRLKTQAARHRRSLNLEVIACLEATARAVPVDAEALLARARAVRRAPAGMRLTEAVLTRLKAAGRP